MSEVANVINNAKVVGTFFSCQHETKYHDVDSNYFSGSGSSITLQPGTYFLMVTINQSDFSSGRTFSFAGMTVTTSGSRGCYMDWKVVTITSATTYTHTSDNANYYAPSSCTAIRLN